MSSTLVNAFSFSPVSDISDMMVLEPAQQVDLANMIQVLDSNMMQLVVQKIKERASKRPRVLWKEDELDQPVYKKARVAESTNKPKARELKPLIFNKTVDHVAQDPVIVPPVANLEEPVTKYVYRFGQCIPLDGVNSAEDILGI